MKIHKMEKEKKLTTIIVVQSLGQTMWIFNKNSGQNLVATYGFRKLGNGKYLTPVLFVSLECLSLFTCYGLNGIMWIETLFCILQKNTQFCGVFI